MLRYQLTTITCCAIDVVSRNNLSWAHMTLYYLRFFYSKIIRDNKNINYSRSLSFRFFFSINELHSESFLVCHFRVIFIHLISSCWLQGPRYFGSGLGLLSVMLTQWRTSRIKFKFVNYTYPKWTDRINEWCELQSKNSLINDDELWPDEHFNLNHSGRISTLVWKCIGYIVIYNLQI